MDGSRTAGANTWRAIRFWAVALTVLAGSAFLIGLTVWSVVALFRAI